MSHVRRKFGPASALIALTLVAGAFSTANVHAAAGDVVWVAQFGSIDDDSGAAVAIDGDGNVYTTGTFRGTVDFDPGAGVANLVAVGSYDVFVSKLDADGNFVWARALGGTDLDTGSAIAVDADGNVYTTGHFRSTADFDPGAGTTNMTPAGTRDAFVLKLNSSGDFVWARQFGGTLTRVEGLGIAVDDANVYTTGYFESVVDFDPGLVTSFVLTSAGFSDGFVSKLDSDGNFVWAGQLGGPNFDSSSGIALDDASNIHTTGYFSGTADFYPGALGTANLTSALPAAFVSKLAADGTFVWAGKLGSDSGDTVGQGIAVDSLGSVHTTGYFTNTVDFDPGVGTSNMTSAGGTDAFVSKLSANGAMVWARQLGGASTDDARAVAVDDVGNVYTTGEFQGTADFDPGAGTSNLTAANIDIFVSKLTSNGEFEWAKQAGGTDFDSARGMTVSAAGEVYITGAFGSAPADFDPGPGTLHKSSPTDDGDVFVWKLEGHELFSVVPARLMDTRATGETVDGMFEQMGPRAAGSTTELQVTGRAGVPADAEAVVLNVTVTRATGGGYVTVYPCGAALPNASNLNFLTGETIPNLVITPIGTAGKVCVFTSAGTDLIADLNGFYPVGSAYNPLVPGRLLDSRIPASPTVDGAFQAIGIRTAGTTTELPITGRGGVPADAAAVVLNITATGALGGGFATVYPCGATQPNASNLNFVAGDTIPNLVITQIGAAGKVCLFTSADTHLIADVNGYYPAATSYTSLVPGRLLDSRTPASPTVDGAFQAIGIRTADSTTELQVTGRHGVPAAAGTAVLNITVTEPIPLGGFVTVYPCGAAQPNASNLNFVAGDNIPNLVITKIGAGGKVCIFTSANTHLIADINGYF